MIYKVENIQTPEYNEALFQKAYNAMSPQRKTKAERYRSLEDKRLCVFADMLLRRILKEHFAVESPIFSANEQGKPVLANGKVHFSISHSKNFIACVADTQPVGIDIEHFRPIPARLINKVCTCEETDFIGAKGEFLNGKEMKKFLCVWTAKEAYLKYTGTGLSGGLQSICTIENGHIKKVLMPNVFLTNILSEEYALSIVSENT